MNYFTKVNFLSFSLTLLNAEYLWIFMLSKRRRPYTVIVFKTTVQDKILRSYINIPKLLERQDTSKLLNTTKNCM